MFTLFGFVSFHILTWTTGAQGMSQLLCLLAAQGWTLTRRIIIGSILWFGSFSKLTSKIVWVSGTCGCKQYSFNLKHSVSRRRHSAWEGFGAIFHDNRPQKDNDSASWLAPQKNVYSIGPTSNFYIRVRQYSMWLQPI